MSRRLIYLPTESEDEDELIMEELDDRSRSESPPTAINRTQMGRRPALPPTPDSTSLQPAPTGRTMNHEAREAYYAGNHSRAQDPETVGSQRSSPHESSTGSDLALVPSRTHRSPPIPEFSDLPRLDDIDSGYEADVSGNTGNSDSRFRRRYSGVRNRRIGFRRRFSNGVDCVQRRPPQRLRGSGVRAVSIPGTHLSTNIRRHPRSLNRADMEVISGLFSHPSLQPAPREVNWHQFKRTMARLGFLVVAGRGNTRFSVSTPSHRFPADSLGEVITAHRPHAGRVALSLREMREIGSRLANAYGWSAETFLN